MLQLTEHLMILMPMMACALWAVVLVLDGRRRGWRAAHRELALWAVVAAVLYGCHAVFFVQADDWMPWADVLYAGCNLAVFPLYLRYLTVLTEGTCGKWQRIATFTPPHFLCCANRPALSADGRRRAAALRAYLSI